MALILCPECKEQISNKAKICIHCGYPIEEINKTEDECKIVLINAGDNIIQTIKLIRAITKVDLKTANEAIKSVPIIIVENINKQEADAIKKEFSIIGADTKIYIGSNNNFTSINQIAKETQTKKQTQRINLPHCPYCNSTNIKKIGIGGRALSAWTLGLAGSKIGKQWHCNNCKSDF